MAMNNKVQVLIYHHKWRSALEIINKAISLNPDYLNIRLSRAIIYEEGFKDYKKAFVDYNKAISLIESDKENNAFIYNSRGNAYFRLGKYKEAYQNFKIATEFGDEAGPFNLYIMSLVSG